jgi:hypothetical protein
MRKLVVVIALLAFVEAGWMLFDGARALIVGDYITPRSGPYAGQLGAWSRVVSAVGIEPRSTLMKSIFAAYGALWLLAIAAFLLGRPWAWAALFVAAVGAVWYLPVGTLLSVVQIGLLLVMHWRK